MITVNTIGSMYNAYNALSGIGGVYGTSSVSPLQALSQRASTSITDLNRQQSAYEVQLSGYGKLKSALADFRDSLSQLDTAAEVSPFKATSSNTAVLSAQAGAGVTAAGVYEINVRQTALAQELQSGSFDSKEATIGSGRLVIDTGRYNAASGSFTPTGESVSIDIGSGNSNLTQVANAINGANAGVRAEVTQTDNGYALKLTSSTGTENTLRIRAQDSQGNPLTSPAGLGQLAFDPTAASGSGRNLSETQAARDAVVEIDGRTITSGSNTVNSGVTGVTLDIKGTGTSSVQVNVNRDATAFRQAVEKFTKALSAFRSTADELGGKTGALAGNGLLASINDGVNRLVNNTSQGYGNNRTTLADIGVTQGANGQVGISSSKLERSFAANPENAVNTLAKAAEGLINLVDRSTGDKSQLGFTTSQLEQSLNSVAQRKELLTAYTQPASMFGLPLNQFSMFSYMFSGTNNSLGATLRYQQVASLGTV